MHRSNPRRRPRRTSRSRRRTAPPPQAAAGPETPDGADEWATEATTDSAEPATRELPALDPPADEAAPQRRTPGDPA
ncbi:hypothetical protein V2I01_08320 [Micromonospora sp. BRA006-A]|nr:hypothetical protein [Micromonospora sp. BRA006-A]